MTNPSGAARRVIADGLGEITRRVEILEADGVTLWENDLGDRLIEGSVNLSYGNNERRTVDMTLRNNDNLLRSQPNGFWYDKVIKPYRGVSYLGNSVMPTGVVVEAQGGENAAMRLSADASRAGLTGVEVKLNIPSFAELLNYDVIFSYTGATASVNGLLLQELFRAGKSVVTISVANGTTVLPFVTTTTAVAETIGISQPAVSTILSPGWTTEARGVATGPYPTALGVGAAAVARYQLGSSAYVITASMATNENGGKWFDLHLPSLAATNTFILFTNAMSWIRGLGTTVKWETQLGEFAIDGISNDYFPSSVKITGRDYVKKCINSKIESPMSFDSTTSLYTFITALAANSGVKKMRLAYMTETLGKTMTFDRGTSRWDLIYQAAEANGYEIYFDSEGYLTTRKFLDPSGNTASYLFQTGTEGNLSSISRSVNDSRIYNHIAVYGDPGSGEERLPYYAEALNEDPGSPTRIARLGDRYYAYASTFFTSQQQCKEYADRLLSLHALESFELSFSAINYPWLEVGEIARVLDPKAVITDPEMYLIDSATIPLGLGPMSFTGKRVTIVG